jgi:hypothetical protein
VQSKGVENIEVSLERAFVSIEGHILF